MLDSHVNVLGSIRKQYSLKDASRISLPCLQGSSKCKNPKELLKIQEDYSIRLPLTALEEPSLHVNMFDGAGFHHEGI